jgi:hypothetical protein
MDCYRSIIMSHGRWPQIMFKRIYHLLRSINNSIKAATTNLKSQFPYELVNVSTCKQSDRHLLEIKISGKSHNITYIAEELVADDDFILGFSPPDIRTICYLAASDKYEKILQDEKIKKSYQIIRSKSINGDKNIKIVHKTTGDTKLVSIKSFYDSELIENLDSKDVFHIGYLAGQEQSWKDIMRLKIIPTRPEDHFENIK